jgi:hypothetical protein
LNIRTTIDQNALAPRGEYKVFGGDDMDKKEINSYLFNEAEYNKNLWGWYHAENDMNIWENEYYRLEAQSKKRRLKKNIWRSPLKWIMTAVFWVVRGCCGR